MNHPLNPDTEAGVSPHMSRQALRGDVWKDRTKRLMHCESNFLSKHLPEAEIFQTILKTDSLFILTSLEWEPAPSQNGILFLIFMNPQSD